MLTFGSLAAPIFLGDRAAFVLGYVVLNVKIRRNETEPQLDTLGELPVRRWQLW